MNKQLADVEEDVEMETELIEADEITQEYDIGEAPPSDDEEDDAHDMNEEEQEKQTDAILLFESHKSPVYALAVHPVDQSLIISGDGNDKAILWDSKTGVTHHILAGHTDSIVAVGFNFDGKMVATGGYDGIVKVWNTETGSLLKSLEGPTMEVEWISWHKKGNVILAGSADGTAWMWLASTGDCMHVFAGHEESVTCGSFTGSGKMIVTGSADSTIRMWNPKSGECIHVFRGPGFHEGPISTIICHPNQPLLLSGSQDGTARLLQLQSKKVLASFKHGTPINRQGLKDDEGSIANSIEALGFSNVMNWCATGCLGGELRIWDLATNNCRHVCKQEAGIIKLIWDSKEPLVYTGAVDGTVSIWDARDGQLIRSFKGHNEMILDINFCSAMNFTKSLITASEDETIQIFGLE